MWFRGVSDKLKGMFSFTPSQARGILFLLPLLAVVGIIITFANRPRFEASFLELADAADSSVYSGKYLGGAQSAYGSAEDRGEADSLFIFDPNAVTLQELCRLGFNIRTASGIIKYRERGKRFEIPEDLAACYGVSLEDYTRLEPYIRISDEFKVKPSVGKHENSEKEKVRPGTILRTFDPNALDKDGFVGLGFSPAQADVIIRYRHSIGGFRSMDDLSRCYVVSGEMAHRLTPYAVFGEETKPVRHPDTALGNRDTVDVKNVPAGTGLIEINSADSATLRSVRGIGEVLVVRIIEYRERLGGFASARQLAEIKGMSPENLRLILEQIRVDSCEIQKIDVNFAPHKTLVERMGMHPYVTAGMLRKLLKNRQLKGGWSTIGDMIEENIMTGQEAERLSPYLLFRSE